jgi:hypothetical protein
MTSVIGDISPFPFTRQPFARSLDTNSAQNHLLRIMSSRILKFLVACLWFSSITLSHGAALDIEAFSKTVFYQVLTNPVVSLEDGQFEYEVKGHPKQGYTLKVQGDDYAMESMGIAVGFHNSLSWTKDHSGKMSLSRTNWNTRPRSSERMASGLRGISDTFLNFGMHEVVRGTLKWDEASQSFIVASKRGGNLVLQFEMSGDVPTRAICMGNFFVDYEYSPTFHGGKIPQRFTRYAGLPGKILSTSMNMEISKFQLADGRMADDLFDPQIIHKPGKIYYESNDATYYMSGGKLQKVLTMEEYKASMASHEASTRKLKWGFDYAEIKWKSVAWVLPLAAGAVVLMWVLIRRFGRAKDVA